MTSWANDVWLSVDLETTGVDVWADRIVEIACIQVFPDGNTGDTYHAIVNPGVDIPDGAAAIHGITTQRAIDEGIHPATAVAEVGRRIFEHGHRPVVIFNGVFDWPILLAEAERHDIEFPFLAPVLDPYLIDKMVDQYRKGSRKLVAVAQHYAVPLDEAEAHGALADATAAARAMRVIVKRNPQMAKRSLASVYLRQVRGHERWREGFVDYKHRQGDVAFDIAPGWPIPALVKGGLPVVASSPAAVDLPESPPDSAGAPGEGVDDARAEPTSTPDPPERGITAADVAKLAGDVFRADYDAAPKGQKTKTLARLRHAFTYACTGLVHCDELDGHQLAVVYQRLHLLQEGAMTYAVTDDGVSFGVAGSDGRAVVAWAQLEPGAAA